MRTFKSLSTRRSLTALVILAALLAVFVVPTAFAKTQKKTRHTALSSAQEMTFTVALPESQAKEQATQYLASPKALQAITGKQDIDTSTPRTNTTQYNLLLTSLKPVDPNTTAITIAVAKQTRLNPTAPWSTPTFDPAATATVARNMKANLTAESAVASCRVKMTTSGANR